MRVNLVSVAAILALAGSAQAATISGTITDAGNAPIAGVFVQAQNTAANRLVSVLSDGSGHFRLSNLPAWQWVVSAHGTGSTGLDSTPQTATVAADQNLTLNLNAAPAPLKWTEISMYQVRSLLPDAQGKTVLYQNCFACHGFETRMAGRAPHSEEEWQTLVDYMVNSMHFFLGPVAHVGPAEEKEVVDYLTTNFGPGSKLPAPD